MTRKIGLSTSSISTFSLVPLSRPRRALMAANTLLLPEPVARASSRACSSWSVSIAACGGTGMIGAAVGIGVGVPSSLYAMPVCLFLMTRYAGLFTSSISMESLSVLGMPLIDLMKAKTSVFFTPLARLLIIRVAVVVEIFFMAEISLVVKKGWFGKGWLGYGVGGLGFGHAACSSVASINRSGRMALATARYTSVILVSAV